MSLPREEERGGGEIQLKSFKKYALKNIPEPRREKIFHVDEIFVIY